MENKLINAVLRQLGDKEYLQDIINHGADAGFPGFTYYSDTADFYKKYKKEINQLAKDIADELGEDIFTMVSNFRAIKGYFSTIEIAKTMYGHRTKQEENDLIQIDNILAWFALEEVARHLIDN